MNQKLPKSKIVRETTNTLQLVVKVVHNMEMLAFLMHN